MVADKAALFLSFYIFLFPGGLPCRSCYSLLSTVLHCFTFNRVSEIYQFLERTVLCQSWAFGFTSLVVDNRLTNTCFKLNSEGETGNSRYIFCCKYMSDRF
ncbi:hypothetical protein ABZP36_015120 [Zizania latifolia]